MQFRAPEAGNPGLEALIATSLVAGVCYWLYRYARQKKKAAHA
jgi:hypothetical protein